MQGNQTEEQVVCKVISDGGMQNDSWTLTAAAWEEGWNLRRHHWMPRLAEHVFCNVASNGMQAAAA